MTEMISGRVFLLNSTSQIDLTRGEGNFVAVDKQLFHHVIVAVLVLNEERGFQGRAALHGGLVVVVVEEVVVVFEVVGVHGAVNHQQDEMRQIVDVFRGFSLGLPCCSGRQIS